MSEENEVKIVKVVDSVEKTHTETAGIAPPEGPVAEETASSTQKKFEGFTPPVLLLLFAVVILFVILVFSLMSGKSGSFNKAMTIEDPSLSALKADIEARRMDLNRQRMESGLPPMEGGSEPIEDIAARLRKDAETLASLSERFRLLLTEKDAQINEASDELTRSQQVRQSLSNEISQLRQEFQKSLVAGAEVSNLKMQLESAITQRQAMSDELLALRQEMANSQGSVTQDQYDDVQRLLQEASNARDFFENRVKELEAQIGQAELFAKSEDELLPAAVQLFRSLRKLEGMKDSDLTTEYSRLGVDLGANVLHTLSFATGSSDLTAEDSQRVQSAIDEIPDGDLALIIGYASVTGDATANERLSSDRATKAAEFYSGIKRNEQLVQAVYLGQTDRFSSRIPERNQICEIWRIRRK
ncbi:hypothetical protein [Luteolibacter sp. AS25]|uniref:hypothetical protein n=1 Tax=Luteolibacter sp. AS25 TaxID=3135776 RepID=UPI00398B9D3D